jgi:hypothetical protein
MSRFDYVKYDDDAQLLQTHFKNVVTDLESDINGLGRNTIDCMQSNPGNLLRAKALAITALEEMYMWIGKAIRDDQIARNGSAPLQEERKNG